MRKLLIVFVVLLSTIFVDAKTIKIITTGDMHGWMESQASAHQKIGGAAEMLTNWKYVEKYSQNDTLILSAGDNFTGAAVSSITEGESVVDLMNIMKYDATVVGNHEFDYGADKIAVWQKKAKFDFISANIYKNDNKASSWQKPYKIFNRDGLKIGVIGLTTTELLYMTNNATAFNVISYEKILRELVPAIRKEGANVIIVLAHVEQAKLIDLAKSCQDLHIPLYIGGHSHEFAQRYSNGAWIVNSGEWWKGYSKIDIEVDHGMTVVTSSKQVYLWGNIKPDIEAENILDKWKVNTESLLDENLGYSAVNISSEPALYNMVTDIWLSSTPNADIAICNYGALRQSIPVGIIKYGTILGVMPFNNKLVLIQISGDKLTKALPTNGITGMSGIKYVANNYLLKNGNAIVPDKIYRVLMTDYQADVTLKYKESPREVVFNSWRDPVIKWLKDNKTSTAKSIDMIIDSKQR